MVVIQSIRYQIKGVKPYQPVVYSQVGYTVAIAKTEIKIFKVKKITEKEQIS